MSIEVSAIHNLLRTYQRVLTLSHGNGRPMATSDTQQDRLSISEEAREEKARVDKTANGYEAVRRISDEQDRSA